MNRVYSLIEEYAKMPLKVGILITGELGTGKELVAKSPGVQTQSARQLLQWAQA